MHEDYKRLIIKFHDALVRKDSVSLEDLLTEQAIAGIADAFEQVDELEFSLTNEIHIDGIEIEGSGKFILINYTNTWKNKSYLMKVEIRDDYKINQNLPSLLDYR